MATETVIKALDDSTSKKQEKARKKAARKDAKPTKIRDEDDLGAELVKITASTVGFISEAVKYRREKKMVMAEETETEEQTPQELPDQAPQLDNSPESRTTAQSPMADRTQGSETLVAEPQEVVGVDDTRDVTEQTFAKHTKEASDLATAFLARHHQRQDDSRRTQLAMPIVVPQRRPEKRARGFVRCYAPILAEAGIDEATFLDFLDTFNRALTPNPYLQAINLAGFAGEAAPDPFSMLIGIAVDVATQAVMEVQSRRASSQFLDRVNAEFFVPRGLVCLVATWAPDARGDALVAMAHAEGDRCSPSPEPRQPDKRRLDEWMTLLTRKTARDALLRRVQRRMEDRIRPSTGGLRWPAAAPLVFPSAEATRAVLVTKAGGGQKDAFDRGEVWMDDFLDRRAQARRMQNSSSSLGAAAVALPEPAFRSRYADPNHPAASGDLVALVTGGRWSNKVTIAGDPGGRHRDGLKADSAHEDVDADGRCKGEQATDISGSGQWPNGEKEKESGKSPATSPFKTLFQKDVLYLLVLGLPEELPIVTAGTDDISGPRATDEGINNSPYSGSNTG